MQRQFLLWMAAKFLVVGLLAFSFPPMAHFVIADPQDQLVARIIGTDLMIGIMGAILATYIEPSISARTARTIAWLMLPVSVLLLTFAPTIAYENRLDWLHDLIVLGLVAMLITALVLAIRAGSRTAAFQAVAWGPLIVVGLVALYFELVLKMAMPFYAQALFAVIAIEFIVTTAGIADGFRIVKRQRDAARDGLRSANRVSALDPLTGIANRRGLEQQFGGLANPRPQGIALIDCDHFKRINDNFGHDIGDEVLVAVAAALRGDGLFPARLGGEEFVLLLYRDSWQRDAEAARQRISAVVAHEVPSLPFPVTASAGLAGMLPDDSLYTAVKRADRALYSAKDAGRDRAISLTDFHRPLTRLTEVT